MRRHGLSAILVVTILVLSSLAAWAATARFTPPPQSGDIFAVVNFARTSGANTSTSITVNWGAAHRTETVTRPYGTCTTSSPAGIVLLVRHFDNASVPFEVVTNGTIVRGPYQGEAPPEISHACYKFVKMRIR